MTQIPTAVQQKNIQKFAEAWSEGETGSGKKVKAKAKRYITQFGDWIYQTNPSHYSLIAGCIEWHNFHGK